MKNACINAYIIEAWVSVICDMQETPHIHVDINASERSLDVPLEYIHDGMIVFNVSPGSVMDYHLDKEQGVLYFKARFAVQSRQIVIPCEAIVQVVSKETSIGAATPDVLMLYRHPDDVEPATENKGPVLGAKGTQGEDPKSPRSGTSSRPTLTVVK